MKSFEPGHWIKRTGYKSVEPSPINRPWRIEEPRILEALSKADRQLGRLDMFSEYLERNRSEYYDQLTRVRDENSLDDWLIFFLDGLSETAARGVETFNEILRVKNHWEKEISAWKPQANSGLALFQYLFTHVWVNTQMVANAAQVSAPTAYRLIGCFVENGLLREITGAKRDRLFLFDPYLNLFQRTT